jgi:hypothetical protein
MGMVGGGRGAFIGGVHRRAAALDGEIELVAGAFSSDPKKICLVRQGLLSKTIPCLRVLSRDGGERKSSA